MLKSFQSYPYTGRISHSYQSLCYLPIHPSELQGVTADADAAAAAEQQRIAADADAERKRAADFATKVHLNLSDNH